MTQREKIIKYFQDMTDEDMYRIFQCQDEHRMYDCPFWVRAGSFCGCKNTCAKVPFEQPWTKKKEEKPSYHVEPEPEQGTLF